MTATKKTEEEVKEETFDQLTFTAEERETGYKGPTVTVFLPALEDPGSVGLKVDQYEHVTIANENREDHYKVRRGVHVSVPVPVYVVLKQSGRYPNL